jgi:plasmid segregation protein ParM
MEKSFTIPSVYEENAMIFSKVADNFVDGIRIVDFNKKDYIIGSLALKEGNAPHKLLNSSAEDIDYQLLALSSMLIASLGYYSKLVVTIGFPNTTYHLYKRNAEKFLLGNHQISFDGKTFGRKEIEKVEISVEKVDVITEIEGCSKAVRKTFDDKENFFIVSLGFGTLELALSTMTGLVHRTTFSTKGIMYAVNLLEEELQKDYYLNMLTDQQIERAFQRGSVISNRKKVDVKDIRKKALQSYYTEVISPSIRKKFNDEDYAFTRKMYLVGGGAMYEELVEMFNAEFQDIVEVVVFPEPYMCAAKGYCINSLDKVQQNTDAVRNEKTAYVGIDLGNSNTAIVVNTIE